MSKRFGLRLTIFPKILVTMLFISLVPLGTIWYIDYQGTTKRIALEIDHRLTEVSDRLVSQVNDWVTMNVKVLNQNATLADITTMDAAKQKPILKAILKEYQATYLIFTMGPDGMNVGRSDDKEPIDYSDRVYYQQAIQGLPLGQQVVISKTNNKPALILAVPIRALPTTGYSAPGAVVGVLAMGMSIGDMSQRISNLRLGQTGYAFLLDEKGKVVAHQKEEYANTSADFSKHPAFLGRPTEGLAKLTYDDGGKQVIAYVQKTIHGWTLVAQQDHQEVYAGAREANIRSLTLLVITLVVVILVAYLFSRGMANPVKNLTQVADMMSRGKVVVRIRETTRSDEIGALAGAIDRMGVALRLAMDRLAKKERALKAGATR